MVGLDCECENSDEENKICEVLEWGRKGHLL